MRTHRKFEISPKNQKQGTKSPKKNYKIKIGHKKAKPRLLICIFAEKLQIRCLKRHKMCRNANMR